MIEKVLAGATLLACVVLLVRLVLPPWQRHRWNVAVRGAARKMYDLVFGPLRAWRLRRSAQRMADEAIRRARDGRGGEWTGNVYRPKSFQKPPKDLERPSKER